MKLTRIMPLLFSATLYACFTGNALAEEQKEKSTKLELALENFAQADADTDKSLDSKEFVRFINGNAKDNIGKASTIKRFSAYKRAFKKLDKDKSKSVSWDEVFKKQKAE